MWNSIALYDKHATITTHVAKALHLFQYVKSILLMGRYRWTWLIHCNGQRDLRPLLHNNPGLCSWLVWQHTQIRQCLFTFLSHTVTHTYILCITVVRRQFYSKSRYDHASNRDNKKDHLDHYTLLQCCYTSHAIQMQMQGFIDTCVF